MVHNPVITPLIVKNLHDHCFMYNTLIQPMSLPINRWKGPQHTPIESFDPHRSLIVSIFTQSKLNPKKFSFGIQEGTFLGQLIMKQGIKANPSKVRAISDLQPQKIVKEIQSLNEKLVALSRFLSKGADKTLPFLKTLKNCTNRKIVQWTKEAYEVFQTMKGLIEKLPTVTTPIKGEALAIKLGEHDIEFRGRNFVKGHILADFLAETPLVENKEIEIEKDTNAKPEQENTWKLYTDGASSSHGSRAGLMLVSPKGKEYTYALRFEFETTNNEAEYEVLLAGLRIAVEMKIQDLSIFVDS
ncbi:reverse transcriptase domain-containing protein [Tanacetum coccineum]